MSKDFDISQVTKGNGWYIDVKGKDDGKYTVQLTEMVEGVRQISRFGFLDVVTGGSTPFMTIRAPLRQVDAEGNFLTRPREKDGQYLDAKGKPVESVDQAALEYVYQTFKDEPGKLVYGQVATLNVKNDKKDGDKVVPTAYTLVSTKIYSDAQAKECEVIYFKMGKVGKDSPEYNALNTDLKTKRKELGEWHNFFIQKGHAALRDLGFEIREKEKTTENTPG
ncbi:hypothetical protein [Pseudomonas serbica]|jgi:hypothetical protein|uniref:hypothetical protein n=1 Tax=Pseudomonas serbica TaxID=2965074 RepID=UPI00237C1FE8|nr:hypothetical protein [Pseudomonas serbica]